MSNPGIAHVFGYRWRRIKEGLQHREVECNWGMPSPVSFPLGVYVYIDGHWYQLLEGEFGRNWETQDTNHVPREIRTLALILT